MSTVMVVDDDPAARSMIRLILEGDGHAVLEAVHGEHALEIIEPDRLPDVIVTDLTMPVLNGAALIGRLQSLPTTSLIPIIVVSANLADALALQASGQVQAVVTKPFDAMAFAECIRTVMQGRLKADSLA